MEKKALGRGLEALLPAGKTAVGRSSQEIQLIPLSQILPNRFQPRRDFPEEGLEQLAESVKRNGVLQPILVRRMGDGEYELIAGERRFRAAKLAKLNTIPALVRNSTDDQSASFSLVENIQRKNLNPMEEARAYTRLMDEFGMTQETIADQVGKDRSSVANISRLTTLPKPVQDMVESELLSLGHAKVILGLKNPQDQIRLADRIVQEGLSVRKAEQNLAAKPAGLQKKVKKSEVSPYHLLEDQLRKRLGTKTIIKKGKRGGQIHINYFSDEDLNRIAEVILE